MGWGYVVTSSASESMRLFTSRAVKAQHGGMEGIFLRRYDRSMVDFNGRIYCVFFKERWVMDGDISFFCFGDFIL